MAGVLFGLGLLVWLGMAAFVLLLGFYGLVIVYCYVFLYEFTVFSGGKILAGVCMVCAAGFLVLPTGASYRERAGFFLTCLTLYSVGRVTANPLLEWLVVASCGLGFLVCFRLLEIGKTRCIEV